MRICSSHLFQKPKRQHGESSSIWCGKYSLISIVSSKPTQLNLNKFYSIHGNVAIAKRKESDGKNGKSIMKAMFSRRSPILIENWINWVCSWSKTSGNVSSCWHVFSIWSLNLQPNSSTQFHHVAEMCQKI